MDIVIYRQSDTDWYTCNCQYLLMTYDKGDPVYDLGRTCSHVPDQGHFSAPVSIPLFTIHLCIEYV